MTESTHQKNFTSIFENFSNNVQEFDGRYEIHQSTSDLFFNDTATTEIYTLSLHDALPISYGFDFLIASSHAFIKPFEVG